MADYSNQIRQLSEARRDTLKAIADMEAASAKDSVDRGHSLALLRRDVVSYNQQLAEIEAALAKETPVPKKKEEIKPK